MGYWSLDLRWCENEDAPLGRELEANVGTLESRSLKYA